ncbi:MAG: caspase family protein [Prosthecobacter sp.]
MRLHIALLTLSLTSSYLAASAEPATRTALVVGNAHYEAEAGPLKNTASDAKAVALTLRSLGFQVIERHNLNRDQLIKAVLEFRATLEGKEVALFYYAGHGLSIGGANYLVPIKSGFNAQAADDVTLRMLAETRLLNVEQAVADMKTAGAGCNLIILDACRTTALSRTGRTRDAADTGGLTEMTPPAGSLIAFATDAGQIALDGNDANGLYTGELLKHLKTPGLTIEQVFKRTRAGVLEVSGGKQIPAEYSRLVGEDIYLAGPVASAEPTPVMTKAEAVTTPTLAAINKLISTGKSTEALTSLSLRAKIEGVNTQYAEPISALLEEVKEALKKPHISAAQAIEKRQICEQLITLLPECLPRSHPRFNELLAKAQNRRGDALLELGLADDALDAFNEAQVLAPDDAYILYNRGRTHLTLGDLESAKADFEAASDPKFDQPKARQLAQDELAKLAITKAAR